ncbi:DUF350 domain-containing protein [Ferrimonas sediminicola]|uniref:DUF350 domain-containing protein n=1 Tax=Ferrimonas sediminicola TaxID=2569538 RepID=A0A4U1BLA8_9GAMM|nr:DUF350 domain-containing protein [Ferrimonas sediminicola]TKB51447.1 DUF350 domain-containing protein [Ferrimonas sediminicola]
MAEWWQWDWIHLALEVGGSLLLLTLLRFSQGWWEGVSSQTELAERDNVAFGISTAGSLLAMALVISSVMPRQGNLSYLEQGLNLVMFGLVGLLLIRVSLWVNDRFAIDRIDKKQHILSGNVAMALTDASAALSAAIIIRALLEKLHRDPSLMGTVSYGLIYLASLAILTGISRWIQYLHDRKGYGPFQQAIEQDQRSVALSHTGVVIAAALILAATVALPEAPVDEPLTLVWSWFGFSVGGLLLLTLWQKLLSAWVMVKINPDKEIALQDNSGVAALEAAQWVGVALLLCAMID